MNKKITNFNIIKIRRDFPVLKQKIRGKSLIYFDSAATTLKPQIVIDAVTNYYSQESSNIHRGIHHLSEKATAKFEDARDKVKKFINAKSDKEIIFTSGTTDSINIIALSYGKEFLKKNDEIIISYMEHHSNIVPWQLLCKQIGCKLKVVNINDKGEINFKEYKKLFNTKTKLVSMIYISNSLGTINPIKKIINEAHKHNIPILIDAAQAVNHIPVNVQDLDCDWLAFSSHKLFGPTGVGVLYGKEDLLNKMPPVRGGGDMIDSVSFDKSTYNILPYKFEAGTPNIAGVIGLGAAIDYIQKIDLKNIFEYEQELLKYGTALLSKIPNLRLIGTATDKTSILSFEIKDIHAHDVGTLLDDEGIATRTGHHCTMPIMDRFNVPATIRASLSFYNTKEELDVLSKTLKKIIAKFY